MAVYKGIDVSKWQGEINWSLVRNAGIQFAMIRSSFGWGKGQKDRFFNTNYTGAKKVGIPVGAYHYSSAIAKAFCEKMESYGYYVCIYANKHWLDNYFTEEIFKKYDIWLAQWSEKPTFERTYGMWQKTSKGKVNGIEGNVDLDESYKNYPAIMKYNGLNGFGAPIEAKPPKRGFTAGQKVVLKNAKLYSSAWSDVVKNHLSGTYYIYDGIYFEGRYRVTNSLSNVERKPIGKYVTGFVHRDDMRNENA